MSVAACKDLDEARASSDSNYGTSWQRVDWFHARTLAHQPDESGTLQTHQRSAEPNADGEATRALRPLQAAAVTYSIAFGPRAGQKVLTLRGATPREDWVCQPLCADIDGFSLHAAVRVNAHDRKRLEQLCRYITRPALSDERVQLNAAGQVELKLKTPWRDGTTHLVVSPLELMQRLAALVPRPRLYLIRFHGVLAPNANLTPLAVPQGPAAPEQAN